ncbi:MAG: hypothetical protein SFU98_02350 [Leptospiraceae bacterium]|nr:hypothetical protein [Leptospiraceae bacterium]
MIYSSPEAASLASEGVGIKEKQISLAANPSYLAYSKTPVVIGSLYMHGSGNGNGAVRPSNLGFYIPIQNRFGIGARFRSVYGSEFPYSERNTSYQTQILGTYALSDSFSFFAGIGPSFTYRAREQSSWSWSIASGFQYTYQKFSVGFSFQRPGEFSYKRYRGVDPLKEKLPDSYSLGLSYTLNQNFMFYSELRRILWERSWFSINDNVNRPDFERGIGAEWKGSAGAVLTLENETSLWKFRTGIEMGGKYDENGKNNRSTGLGLGLTYIPGNETEHGSISYSFSMLDYSLLAKKGGRFPETLFYFGISYIPPDTISQDNSIVK